MSVCGPATAGAIEHDPGPAYAGLMVQGNPVPAGRESLKLALVAVPAPVLLAVTVKPMAVPALTVAASAVLLAARLGHSTASVAVFDVTGGAVAALRTAVFE